MRNRIAAIKRWHFPEQYDWCHHYIWMWQAISWASGFTGSHGAFHTPCWNRWLDESNPPIVDCRWMHHDEVAMAREREILDQRASADGGRKRIISDVTIP